MSLQAKFFSALRTKTARHQSPVSKRENRIVAKAERPVVESNPKTNPIPSDVEKKERKLQHNVKANFRFAIILYTKSIKELPLVEGNTLISGLGTWLLLSLTASGACGTTLAELQDALFINNDNAENVQRLLERLNPPGQSLIQIATKVLIQEGYEIEEGFRDNAAKCFGSGVDTFDPNEAQKLVHHVNTWVKEKTEGKIGAVLPPDFEVEHTRMLLVNAIYFKAAWHSPFDKDLTQDRPFHIPGSQGYQKVLMMNKDTFFMVARPAELSCAIVQLPYKGRSVGLYIFVPDEMDGLAKVEEQLIHLNMEELTFEKEQLDFFLPKFKIESDWNLVPILKSMGIQSLFDNSSVDLSAIHASRSSPLHVSQVSQRAAMEVDEDGATAAAVTSFTYVDGIGQSTPELVCDHPFMFMVYDSVNCLPYFMGRICNPQSDFK
ncbi:hypothetical protein TCAL_13140 [Tigriopus californicus]|uniref:Serpin domain-containing protein n=1 Tax=Tigriopus californicus TaxID=6832 RepID=A0A553PS84_TIGCA|nr:serpin B6-like [Tigriopus californicus]TRY80535.1 hypothetical protein TCAL_13140 [Tigriopus californicus]|eukprot:TCALIF_13140-PA protein Name:"Similar to SERPINB9 Serpin B9 (Homo sapiens)" AED:0.04 eAED:0.04 QI:0/-1/0/1/-1/1/1/0/434